MLVNATLPYSLAYRSIGILEHECVSALRRGETSPADRPLGHRP